MTPRRPGGLPAPAGRTDIDVLARLTADWQVIDDVVMGGRSRGTVASREGVIVFSGNLSLDNQGGFSSIRVPIDGGLPGCIGLRLSARGDGRSYQLRLRRDRARDGIAWAAPFAAGASWRGVELAFSRFQPRYRGREVPEAGPLQPASVEQIGFMLLGQPGAFRLEIRSIIAVVDMGTDRSST